MQITDFVASIQGFNSFTPKEKIQAFAWYLHTYAEIETFENSHIRDCFRETHLVVPDISVYLPRMAEKKPPDLIRVKGAYKLEGTIRRSLDAKYGCQRTIMIAKLLSDLPGQIPNLAERGFLAEALSCYKVGAFRAAIVMTWNLALDHFISYTAVSKVGLMLQRCDSKVTCAVILFSR